MSKGAYISRCPNCRGINAACAVDFNPHAGRMLKAAAKQNLTVETVTDDDVRRGPWCSCHRTQQLTFGEAEPCPST